MSLSDLGRKLFVLISLAKPIRAVEVVNLLLPSLPEGNATPDSVTFRRGDLPKSQRSGPLSTLVIESLAENPNLCVVNTTLQYLSKSRSVRENDDGFLFISPVKPHHHIKPSTGLQWRVKALRAAGITTHTGHSFRGAVASYLEHTCKVPMQDIMREGGWRSANCLKKHYLRR